MPRDINSILNFLYGESEEASGLDEIRAVAGLFEGIEAVAKLDVKVRPLEDALKSLGIDPEVGAVLDNSRMAIEFEDEDAYLAAVSKLKSAEGTIALADTGWVASFPGEKTTHVEIPVFTVHFVDISLPNADGDDATSVPDYEAEIKAAIEAGGATEFKHLGKSGPVEYDKTESE